MAITRLFQVCLFYLCLYYNRSTATTAMRDDCDVEIIVTADSLLTVEGSCNVLPSTGTIECDSLDSALSLASRNITNINCTQILLQPGLHLVTSVYSFEQSVVLGSEGADTGQVYVTFAVDPSVQGSLELYEPLYLLEFNSVDYVGINGIRFSDSPGLIGIFNTTQVEIENCEFRYVPFIEYTL